MGCKSCRDKGRNRGKLTSPKFVKCNFCGRIDVPYPLKNANKRGKKVICKNCILS